LYTVQDEIGDILGDKNKIRMIMALYDKGAMKKTDLYEYASRNSLNPRKLDEMEKANLISQNYDRFQNNMTTVSLTDLGRDVARKLRDIEGLMSGELAVE